MTITARNLLSVIAKTATPTVLADLMNRLITAEAESFVTDAEAEAAQTAIDWLLPVLHANVGEEEAQEMLSGRA